MLYLLFSKLFKCIFIQVVENDHEFYLDKPIYQYQPMDTFHVANLCLNLDFFSINL